MAGPGRIIVGAAGNEGSTALHVGKDLEEGDTSLKTMIGFSENSASKQAYVDIWGSKGAPLKVKAVVVDALKGKVMYESPAVETDGETEEEIRAFCKEKGMDVDETKIGRAHV